MEGPTTTLVIDSIPKPPTRIDSSQLTELLARIYAVAGETDDEKKFPEKAFQWLANAGLLAVTLPGHQLDQQLPRTTGLLQLLKRIGAANLSVGRVYEGHINALSLIQHYAKPMQKKHGLPM